MISVIMSAYNVEKYIVVAIESILKQTFTDFEFIIVNDCSQDKTLNIIKKYVATDERIKVISNKKNIGLTKSLNRAIKLSTGKYIARMDADDISHPCRFESQYKFMENNKDIVVLGTAAININEKGNEVGQRDVPLSHEDIYKTIALVNPIIHPSVMFRRKYINDIGNYNEKYRVVQDYELWFRCLANGYKMANLSDRLLYYRINDKYFDRKSFNYRMTDFKIKWQGYNSLNLLWYKRYGIFIPLILGIIPDKLLAYSYKYLKKYDPRSNG